MAVKRPTRSQLCDVAADLGITLNESVGNISTLQRLSGSAGPLT